MTEADKQYEEMMMKTWNELQKKKEADKQKAAPKRRSASRAKSSEPVAPQETEPKTFAELLQRKTAQAKAESKGKEDIATSGSRDSTSANRRQETKETKEERFCSAA